MNSCHVELNNSCVSVFDIISMNCSLKVPIFHISLKYDKLDESNWRFWFWSILSKLSCSISMRKNSTKFSQNVGISEIRHKIFGTNIFKFWFERAHYFCVKLISRILIWEQPLKYPVPLFVLWISDGKIYSWIWNVKMMALEKRMGHERHTNWRVKMMVKLMGHSVDCFLCE